MPTETSTSATRTLTYERARQRLLWWLTLAGRVHLVAVLVVGAVALGLTSGAHADPAPLCDTDASCAALDIGTGYGVTEEKVATYGPVLVAEATATPGEWDCLRGLGYVGKPLDGVEALYADGSDVAECSPRPV